MNNQATAVVPTVTEQHLIQTNDEMPSFIIARTAEDVVKAYADNYGQDCLEVEQQEYRENDPDGSDADFINFFVSRLDHDANFTIVIDDFGTKSTKTVRDWIQEAIDNEHEFPYLLAAAGA